ncbi:MAG: hypothetical protein KHX49_12445 [Lachnospiraceae bacterium]|nr:hypothetical protein [Lachnospiraceae bacterium]
MMRIQEWDTDYGKFYDEIDREHIYKYPYSGLFSNPVVIKKTGEVTESYVYIPESAVNSMQGVMILPDEKEDPVEFLEKSGWMEEADEQGIILITTSYGKDLETLREIYLDLRNRRHFNVNKAYRYLVGYGKSAADAMRMTVRWPQEVAGVVCVGEIGVREDELKEEGSKPSDLPYIPLCQVPVPVWMVTEQPEMDLIDYWKNANQSETAPYLRRGITEYHAKQTGIDPLTEHQAGALLWVSGHEDHQGERFGPKDFYEYFLAKTQRATAIANGDLNPVRTMEEWGMARRTMVVDGYRREWYEFIPDENRRYQGPQLPLVVFFHGGSNQAWANIQTTALVKVAAARGFALAFPTGTMRRREQDHAVPHPAWNAGMLKDHMDDFKFVRLMIEDIKCRNPIDPTRIYSCGHSMGACMGQQAALVMPDVFAACAVTGGVIKGLDCREGFFGSYRLPAVKTGYEVPVWIMLGEHDTGGGDLKTNQRANVNVEYWIKRNGTQEKERPMEYRSGRYHHRIWQNRAGVPLLDFTTVKDKPHAFTPQDGWLFYDEWFSKFSRAADGTLYYMGAAVERINNG